MSNKVVLSEIEKSIEKKGEILINEIINYQGGKINKILFKIQEIIHLAQKENTANKRHLSYTQIYDNFIKMIKEKYDNRNLITDTLYYDSSMSNKMYHKFYSNDK